MEEKNESVQNENIQAVNNFIESSQINNDAATKKKKVPAALICAILGVALVVLGLVAPKVFLINKSVVKSEISSVFNMARKRINVMSKNTLDFDLDKDVVGVTGNLSVKSDYKTSQMDLTKLNKYKVTYGGVISKKDNEANFLFKLAESKDIIDVKGYAKGKNIYVSLGDLYNKILSGDMGSEVKDINFSNTNYKNYDKLLAKTEVILKNNIDEKSITKTKEEKEFSDGKKTYTKISYEIDLEDQYKKLLTAYRKDKEIIKLLSEISGSSEKEIMESLDAAIKPSQTSEDQYVTDSYSGNYKEKITLNTYLDGFFNKTRGIELISDNTTLLIEVDGKTYNYKILSSDKEVVNGVYDEAKKEFTFNSEEGSKINFNLNWSKKNTINGNFQYSFGNSKYGLVFTLNSIVKGVSMSNTFNGKVSIESGEEKINFEIDTDQTTTKGAKVEKIDTANAVSYDMLSENDIMTIYNNLQQKLGIVMNEIVPSMSSEQLFRMIY